MPCVSCPAKFYQFGTRATTSSLSCFSRHPYRRSTNVGNKSNSLIVEACIINILSHRMCLLEKVPIFFDCASLHPPPFHYFCPVINKPFTFTTYSSFSLGHLFSLNSFLLFYSHIVQFGTIFLVCIYFIDFSSQFFFNWDFL